MRRRTPWEVWQAAYSKQASCSTSLITRNPSGGAGEQVGGVLDDPVRLRRPPQLVDDEGGGVDPPPIGELLPADDADPVTGADPLAGQDLADGSGTVPGLAGEAEVLVEVSPHGDGAAPAIP